MGKYLENCVPVCLYVLLWCVVFYLSLNLILKSYHDFVDLKNHCCQSVQVNGQI